MGDSPTEQVLALVSRIQRSMHSTKFVAGIPRWLSETSDLTMAQLRALMVIRDSGPLSISQLSEQLRIGLPSTSAMVEHLVEDGLFQRSQDPADRRRTLVSTTDLGEHRVDVMRQGPRELLQAWLARLTDDEIDALRRGMTGLVRVSDGLTVDCGEEVGAALGSAPEHPVEARSGDAR
ncbi:MAG: MarR family transcriptional regulator [Candidatus Dormiibacterota bacterium]